MATPDRPQNNKIQRSTLLGASVMLLAWQFLGTICVRAQNASVATPEELRAALLTGATTVAITRNLNFNPENWPDPPVVIRKQVTIHSVYRVKLDFCGSNGAPARPLIVVTAPGSLLLQKLFLRNFLPSVPQNLSGLGPVPAVLSKGGQVTFRLVVFHFLPAVTSWVFSAPPADSFWAREGPTALISVYTGQGLQLERPSLYLIKYSSQMDPVAKYSMDVCYSPLDLNACYADNDEDTTLIYCLYTFADALLNPAVRYIRIFHDIGLDRLAYSRFKPIVVGDPKSFYACPGARPSINMENLYAAVTIRHSVSFSGVRFKSSLPTNYTAWPPNLPLLPSLFDVSGSGVLSLKDTIVDVPDLAGAVARLKALPACCSADPTRPDLQPKVVHWPSEAELAAVAGKATKPVPSLGGSSGVIYDAWRAGDGDGMPDEDGWPVLNISHWVLERNTWQRYAGGTYDVLNTPSSATWRYENVVVRQADNANARALCFGGALEQGAVMRRGIRMVGDELQLRDALVKGERFVQVVADIKLTAANWPGGGSALVIAAGIIEVRGCHPQYGQRYNIDLSDLAAVLRTRGRLIFQGDLRFINVGWTAVPKSQLLSVATGVNEVSPLGAFSLADSGSGSVECEGVVIDGLYDPEAFRYQDLLAVLHLNHMTAEIRSRNASLRDEHGITLGFWTVPQASPAGQWVFTNTDFNWTPITPDAATSSDSGAPPPLQIIIPSVVCGALLVAAVPLAFVLYRSWRRRRWPQEGTCALQSVMTLASTTPPGAGLSTHHQPSQLKGKAAMTAGEFLGSMAEAPTQAHSSGGDCTYSEAAALAAVLHAANKIIGNGNSNGSASGTRTDMSGMAAAALAVMGKSDRPVGGAGGAERQENGPASTRADTAGSRCQGPLGDINAAKREMVAGRNLPCNYTGAALDDLVLQSVLGEGSYGRVYRALWRGTTVAVKVILLPAHMSGRERHERMAVMEAAISSSLSHPNIVQTYTYGVECVEGAKARARLNGSQGNSALPEASTNPLGGTAGGPGAGAATGGVGAAAAVASGPRKGATGAGGVDGAEESGRDIMGWEIRLVQEFCDLGSLRDKLNGRVFFRSAPAEMVGGSVAGGIGSGTGTGGGTGGAGSQSTVPQPLRRTMSPLSPFLAAAVITEEGEEADVEAPAVAGATPAALRSGGGGCSGEGSGAGEQQPAAPAAAFVDLPAVLDTAIDVARALTHLHREGIVHADLKPRNVLLKGSTTDPRGFVAKVADFGLSMRLDHNETHISNAYHGTLAYMAPETLLHGHVSRASDVYGFGILLYELYTGDVAFRGVPKALIGHAIAKDNLRPVFPPALGAPFEYQLLACRCWESNPEIRPEFDFILEDLKRMRVRLCAESPEGSSSYGPLARQAGGTGEPLAGRLWGLPMLPHVPSQQGVLLQAPSTQTLHAQLRVGGGYGGFTDGEGSLSASNSVTMGSINALTGLNNTVSTTVGTTACGGAAAVDGGGGVRLVDMGGPSLNFMGRGAGVRPQACTAPYPDTPTGGVDEEAAVAVRSL